MRARLTSWGYVDVDGRAHHGRELDEPESLEWCTDTGPCSRCGLPSSWRTARGRRTHPVCDPRVLFDRLSLSAQLELEVMVCELLPVASVDVDYTPPGRRARVVAYSGEPCSICHTLERTLSYTLVQRYRAAYVAVRCQRHAMT